MRWLFRGSATRCLSELRDKLLQFFREKSHDFQEDLESSKEFVTKLAYLSDIFEVLNNFNSKVPTELYLSIFQSWKRSSVNWPSE